MTLRHLSLHSRQVRCQLARRSLFPRRDHFALRHEPVSPPGGQREHASRPFANTSYERIHRAVRPNDSAILVETIQPQSQYSSG
jgi:hypothetical protein